MVLAALLSLAIGVSLGLLGGGGSILTVPTLVYALGVEPKEAIAASLVVVGVTSLAGLVQHARAGHVAWRTGLVFGGAGMVGAYGGGLLAGLFSGRTLLLLFAGMMVATAVAMLRTRGAEAVPRGGGRAGAARIVLDGLVVGAVTGLVGAGGGFLVVPALAILGGLPMRQAVGTSLLVIAMKSFAGTLGHASHVAIDVPLVAAVSAASVTGALVGGLAVQRVPPEMLRKGFAALVLGMAAFQIVREI